MELDAPLYGAPSNIAVLCMPMYGTEREGIERNRVACYAQDEVGWDGTGWDGAGQDPILCNEVMDRCDRWLTDGMGWDAWQRQNRKFDHPRRKWSHAGP